MYPIRLDVQILVLTFHRLLVVKISKTAQMSKPRPVIQTHMHGSKYILSIPFSLHTNPCCIHYRIKSVYVPRALDFVQDWWAEVTHGTKNGGSFSEMKGPLLIIQLNLS